MHKRMTVREARARLSELMKGTEAVPIGDHYQLRAIIVPIPGERLYTHEQKRDAAKKARAAFEATLKAQLAD